MYISNTVMQPEFYLGNYFESELKKMHCKQLFPEMGVAYSKTVKWNTKKLRIINQNTDIDFFKYFQVITRSYSRTKKIMQQSCFCIENILNILHFRIQN